MLVYNIVTGHQYRHHPYFLISFGRPHVGLSLQLMVINLLTNYEQHMRNAASLPQDKLAKLDAGKHVCLSAHEIFPG